MKIFTTAFMLVRFAIGSARDGRRVILRPLRRERGHQRSQHERGREDLHRPIYLQRLLYTHGEPDARGGSAGSSRFSSHRTTLKSGEEHVRLKLPGEGSMRASCSAAVPLTATPCPSNPNRGCYTLGCQCLL